MQVTMLLLILLEVAVCAVSALPLSTVSLGGTLGRCVDCSGSRRAGRWRGDPAPGHSPVLEEDLHHVQEERLTTLLAHVDTTRLICETSVTLTTYTEELTSTLASYTTLLQQMGRTEAVYQSEVRDTDPAFSQLADLTQNAGCGMRLSVGVGRLCDRRAVPTETALQLHDRFWWDIKIVKDLKVFVHSARQCMRHWERRQLWSARR